LTIEPIAKHRAGQESFPLRKAQLHRNRLPAELLEEAVSRKEGRLASTGAFMVETGKHTGRSARDKFTVKDDATGDQVWWDNNRAIARDHFTRLHDDMIAHAAGKELFVQDLFAGADPTRRLKVRVYAEFAWHALFISHLLIKPERAELGRFEPDLTIVDLPSFHADPDRHGVRSETAIAVDFPGRLVLIGGSRYAGEIKKSVFTFLNYALPPQGVMPMHCSANVGTEGDVAIFFGLSGTGKTTLSADPKRTLLGDDEHGWSDHGIYNFEGGCYAKTIRLSPQAEPQIWAATNRFGTVLENVVLDPRTREPDYDDGRLTENARAAYPLEFIPNASRSGRAGHPRNIIMLTADAFGVLPPIAKLSATQAMYHFLSGYTAKVAGTEKGVEGVQATFSTCFGAPFMPRHPSVYGNLLRDKIAEHDVDCWLVNTGWTGGKYGEGRRMPIAATRALLDAALSGKLKRVEMRADPIFGFQVPLAVEDIDGVILRPRETWANASAYDEQARALVGMFGKNFERFSAHVDADIRAAAPTLR
jgi:phosphoenolpyruvate carboxykinase (ATP)